MRPAKHCLKPLSQATLRPMASMLAKGLAVLAYNLFTLAYHAIQSAYGKLQESVIYQTGCLNTPFGVYL
jgi:hypothetical protein